MPDGPLTRYRAQIAAGALTYDTMQELAVEKLASLHHALADYRPETGSGGWRARFGLARRRLPPQPPQGLYLFGEVGRGKSMLMDLFFSAAPVQRKRRVHFHDFMQDVHNRLHGLRSDRAAAQSDPIPPVAAALAEEAWLLCFDELQVTDITDAMILGRLFEQLFARGVVVVCTSNRPPGDLYKDGLQRQNFLPFIDMIQEKLDVLELASATDYRLRRLQDGAVFHFGADQNAALQDAFAGLTEGAKVGPDHLVIKGREVHIPLAGAGVARFSFEDLCTRPLGPGDYIALAVHFHTLVLSDIPRIPAAKRDWAKRFVTLIDALYEHRVNLVAGFAAPLDTLYPDGDYAFEFKRCISRLVEMKSREYLALPHLT